MVATLYNTFAFTKLAASL